MASQLALRDAFTSKHSNIRYGLGEWRQYDSGIWAPIPELLVKRHVQEIIQTSSTKLSSGLVTSVTELLKSQTLLFDQIFDYNPNILVLNDCCLDLTTYSPTPHSPIHYATTKLSFNYDPNFRSNAWDVVSKGFPHENVLRRFAGLALTTETKYEVALWLYGPPGGGKSTFIAGLEAMLGSKACVLGLDEIGRSNFALSQIPGKTLAVSTEQPAGFVKCSHKLNAIISGESLTIDQKFKPQFTILPKVKLLWAMNDLPMIPSGAGAGLFRRVYPVYWPGLIETERNPEFKEEIARSGMAIVNWALEGLKELQACGRFIIPPDLAQARDSYREQSDMTLCFIDDCCDSAEVCEVESGKLYDQYVKWCERNGHKHLASNRFATDLQRLGFTKLPRRATGVFWSGLELKLEVEFPVGEDVG